MIPTFGHKAELWQLIRDGVTYIRVACPRCRVIKDVPWRLLGRVDLSWTPPEVASRMRCSRCGAPPDPNSLRLVRRIQP